MESMFENHSVICDIEESCFLPLLVLTRLNSCESKQILRLSLPVFSLKVLYFSIKWLSVNISI